MKKLLFLFLFINSVIQAQRQSILWERTFGGSDNEDATSICFERNGLCLVLGSSSSVDGDISGHLSSVGDRDFWFCRIDSLGTLLYDKSFGGSYNDDSGQLIKVKIGGYIMCGNTSSDDIDVSGNHSLSSDIWLAKIDDSLNIEWQTCLGSTMLEWGFHVSESIDSNYFFLGSTVGNDSDVSGNHGDRDNWLGKVDRNGTLLWQLCLGSPDHESGGSILATDDGGVLFTGSTATGAGTYCSSIPIGYNVWLVKLDSFGNIEWEKCLGSSSWDAGVDLISDGRSGYYVASSTYGNDGDVTGHFGLVDVWVLNVDSLGSILWGNCFGGQNGNDIPRSIALTPDFGVIVCGYTNSTIGQATGYHGGGSDCFIVKIDSSGNYQWSGCYGGSNRDEARSVVALADGSIIFSGVTESSDGDVSFNHGGKDYWVVKLEAPVSVQEPIDINLFSYKITESKLELFFDSKFNGKVEINLLDLTGRQLMTSRQNYSSGKNEIEIPVNVVGGIYIVQLKTAMGAKSFKVFSY